MTIINNVQDLGKALRQYRKEQKLTQEELAASAGVGVRFLVDLEAGKETISLGLVLKVIAMLGKTLELQDK